MAPFSSGSTSSGVLPGNWAPAVAALPPPPRVSQITWTLTLPLDRAER